MKKTAGLILALLAAVFLFAAGKKNTEPEKPANPSGLKLKYVEWDAHMLGVDSPEKIAALKKSVKRVPVIGLVGFSGIILFIINNSSRITSYYIRNRLL